MEYLLNKDVFTARYNCSFFDHDMMIPREKRRHIAPGVFLLLCFVVLEVLYLPCIGVFARKENRRESCYKLMLFMGILGMINLHSSCLLIGVYAIRGDVFCDQPLFTYVSGMLVYAFYCSDSLMAVILALNRCVEMCSHQMAETLFSQHRTYYWMAFSLIYGALHGFLTVTPLPNGLAVGYIWNPYFGYFDDTEGWYHNILFPGHNFLVGAGIPLIYAVFYLVMRRKMHRIGDQQQQDGPSKEQRKIKQNIFIQVLLIGLLMVTYSLLYVYMQYFPVPVWVSISAHYAWTGSHGLIPIIYIVLNKYVRNNIKSLFIGPIVSRFTTIGTESRLRSAAAISAVASRQQ